MASRAFISLRIIVIKEVVEHESVLHRIIMWKRLSNPRPALILSKNHSTQTKCLVCDSLFVLMETWKIVAFSFQAFLPNTSALLVQSRPSQCVCVFTQAGRQKRSMYGERTALRQCVWTKRLQEVRWNLKSLVCAGWFTLNNEHTNCKTHRRSGGSFLSGGTRGTHGHVPIERTNCSTCPLHWVGKGGHLLQDHFLTNLDHMLSGERRALCNKSLPHPSLEMTQLWDM